MRHEYPRVNLSEPGIRPFFRIAGALLFLASAALLLWDSSRIWSAAAVAGESCDAERRLGVPVCYAINWLLKILPSSLHGPLSAVLGTFAGIFGLGVAWILLRPLLARRPKA